MTITGYVLQNHRTGEFIGVKSGENNRCLYLTKTVPKIYKTIHYAKMARDSIKGFNNLVIRQVNMEVRNVA